MGQIAFWVKQLTKSDLGFYDDRNLNEKIMLTKRIIPCLDIKDGRTVKGVNFVNLRDAGDPVELATKYAYQNADELVLDISATEQKRKTLAELVLRIAASIDIPFTVGGGIVQLKMFLYYWKMVRIRFL